MEPPPFQEALLCDICKCSFNTFRRRHHCRCCGRTLCAEHSSNQMALPQFGIHSFVRVCSDCFSDASRLRKDDLPSSLHGVNVVTDAVSTLDINAIADSNPKPTAEQISISDTVHCKCGMPLCICEAPAPSKDAVILQNKRTSSSTGPTNPKAKKTDTIPKNRGSSSNSQQFMIFSLGQVINGGLEKSQIDYEVNGEGLREAIKNGDTSAVKELLSKGVDANYCDKQGSSLLHLAALFNRTDIAFALMECGASLDCRNSQGETPLDCAPATLQYKMQKKMEESEQLSPGHII
ncbi:vacuolar protein sorting-associated protein 27 [Actinidia eriantha]|uniref:vacuolar protein sorting-associated protein 27 n=1 Tax=Actinidia eriantha TaxID=165200 RepID=UPI00258DE659|nr:vacuolar protein sorting-associated protein 27 [Actinidia eriantha]